MDIGSGLFTDAEKPGLEDNISILSSFEDSSCTEETEDGPCGVDSWTLCICSGFTLLIDGCQWPEVCCKDDLFVK